MASETSPAHGDQIGNQPLPNDTPPSYNDATGTLNVQQDGLNTQTQVGGERIPCTPVVNLADILDDGRVNIRVNETDTELAQQIAQVQLNAVPENPENPPSYLDTRRPPALNIVIHVVGSRGDVQPFVALGRELKNTYGHRIRLATHGTFKKFVEENGLEFFDIGGDPAELMAFMVKNPGLIPNMKSLKDGDVGKRQKGMAEILQGCWKSCADANEVQQGEDSPLKAKPFIANAIIANPPSFAHIHCAEKLGIPLHLMFT
jgi:hypothetical protein